METRYAVACFDTNGVGRLVGDPNDFGDIESAKARIQEIEGPHTKPHKVDYSVLPYLVGRRAKTLKDCGVVL